MALLSSFGGLLSSNGGLLSTYGDESGEFDINSLFANSELGALYDHSDLTTLYQESAGITSVSAASDPVGLRLDKSQGMALGAEKVINGGFDTDTSWIKGTGWTIADGVAQSDGVTASALLAQDIGSVAGKSYALSMDIDGTFPNGSFINIRLGLSGTLLQKNSAGTVTAILTAAGSNPFRLYITTSATIKPTVTLDNVSVKELAGHQAYQNTAPARPAYKTVPSRIDFDGIDDVLATTFPDLGTDVTIARSIPGVGASILTGQTISAGAWSDNVDSCALVIVNRALTTQETAGLTSWLNEKAGV
jgi:hypothetical protein